MWAGMAGKHYRLSGPIITVEGSKTKIIAAALATLSTLAAAKFMFCDPSSVMIGPLNR